MTAGGLRRRRLASATVCAAALAAAAGRFGIPSQAAAAAHLDVANVGADAAAVLITAQSQYSFVVNPDAQLPRASASIGADRALAVAGPADPGDDVDALPGTAIPIAEGTVVAQLAAGARQAPPPLSTVLAAGAKAAGRVFVVANPVTHIAGVPVEHAAAAYPDGVHGGEHATTFGPDPSVADPTGNVAVDAALGRAVAGPDVAVADAGAGGGTVATPLGLTIGRFSAHAETHVRDGIATSDAVSEVDDISVGSAALGIAPSLLPPSTPGATQPVLLHIAAVRAVLHTERVAGAAHATATTSLALLGVTVLGHAATIDGSGIHVEGAGAALQPVVDALDRLFVTVDRIDALLPRGTPFGGHPVVPLAHLAGPVTSSVTRHGGDEVVAGAAGLTLSLRGTVLVPASTAVPPSGPPRLVPSPVTLTITLASARSSAYGRSLPGASASGPLGPPAAGPSPGVGAPSRSSAAPVPAARGSAAATGPTTVPAPPAPASAAPGGALEAVTTASGAPIPRGVAVGVATVAELLLLGALVASYRRTLPRVAATGVEDVLP